MIKDFCFQQLKLRPSHELTQESHQLNSRPGERFFFDIKEDLKCILAHHDLKITPRNILWALFGMDAYPILLLFRLRMLARRYRIPLVNRLLRGVQTALYSIELGSEITLGHGVYFVHSLGTVVGQASVIGKACVFYGNNTVGGGRDSGSPRLGMNVKIGAGARILGSVDIGDSASIGANAVVLKDVPRFTVAVGVPATIVP
jgi:serine O-acetyltransferase